MVNTEKMTIEIMQTLAFSEEEKAALAKAREKSIVFDKDCPEVTAQQARKFKRVNPRLDQLGKRA